MKIYIVCELGVWLGGNRIPRQGASIRNDVFHSPLKGFRTKEEAETFIQDELEKSDIRITYHDFECFEVEVKGEGNG